MTQSFCFESDSLESLEKVLRTVFSVVYSKFDKFYECYLTTQEPEYWEDGSKSSWDECPSIYQTGGKYLHLGGSYIYGGARILKKTAEFDTLDKAAEESSKQFKHIDGNRMFLCGVSDYELSFEEKESFQTTDKAVDRVIEICRNASSKENIIKFFQKKGDGYTSWFNGDDGSVDIGWRVHWEPDGGFNKLYISMIHVYYGK